MPRCPIPVSFPGICLSPQHCALPWFWDVIFLPCRYSIPNWGSSSVPALLAARTEDLKPSSNLAGSSSCVLPHDAELQDHHCWAGCSQSPGKGFWLCRGLRAGRSQQSMQMSKFSLSSHPCGMQDESCPNGVHSCCFGGLCRCVPGHAGRENHTQPRFLLPWQPVHMEKGGTAPLGGWAAGSLNPAFHPGDAAGRKGGCQGSSWDGADRRGVVSPDPAGRQCWKTALLILCIHLDFSLVPDQKGILLLQEAEVGSVKQGFNMSTHSLESRGLLPGCIPCYGDLWLQKSLGWSLGPVYGYRSHF